MRDAPRRCAGFTLVEVLVAQVVLAVGLLGVAGLLLGSLRTGRSGLAHTQAVALAADVAERIRARRAVAGAYDCAGPCEAGDGGSAAATADLDAWREAVAAQLPGGTASLSHEPGAAGRPAAYVVGLHWADDGSAAGSSYQLRLELAEATW